MALPTGLLRRRRAATYLASLATVPALLACGAPAERAALAAGRVLYVPNGRAGTVTRLDPETGRPIGAPLPAGLAPWLVAPGPGGALLVLSIATAATGTLTHVVPRGAETLARTIHLAPGAALEPQSTRLAAGGGGDGGSGGGPQALAAYRAVGAAASTLALLDVRSGEILRSLPVGLPVEKVMGLALDDGPAGPVAYVGLWTEANWLERRAPSGRVLAVDARSGAVLGARGVPGVPSQLVLGAAAGPDRRLYVAAGAPVDPDGRPYGPELAGGVLDLEALTLAERAALPLPEPLAWLAVAPDGATAYAISGTLPSSTLVRLDLATGRQTAMARLPGPGLGLAIAGQRLYVPAPEHDEVWVLDRARGTLTGRVSVPSPISITGPT